MRRDTAGSSTRAASADSHAGFSSNRELTASPNNWIRSRSQAGIGEPIGGEVALSEHQEWCLDDAQRNQRLVAEVARLEGEVTQEALVAAAEHYRLAREGASPYD
jgi:hypothetical protein